ncbi:MAG TPA: hypothetical protein VFV50_03130, partial [Bdellovibrionales bacterium]|nr:hypothetical protein [Bdellovibrionales bacterium]
MFKLALSAALLAAICFTTAIGLTTVADAAIAEKLVVKADLIYPEGIAFNPATSEFYVSSLRKGTIGAVSEAGTYTEFSSDPDLISTIGMSADVARGRLLVCVSDPGVGLRSTPKTKETLARLVVFDLRTKKKLKTLNLGALKKG